MKYSYSAGKVSITRSNKTGNMNVFIFGKASGGSRLNGSKKKSKVRGMKKK